MGSQPAFPNRASHMGLPAALGYLNFEVRLSTLQLMVKKKDGCKWCIKDLHHSKWSANRRFKGGSSSWMPMAYASFLNIYLSYFHHLSAEIDWSMSSVSMDAFYPLQWNPIFQHCPPKKLLSFSPPAHTTPPALSLHPLQTQVSSQPFSGGIGTASWSPHLPGRRPPGAVRKDGRTSEASVSSAARHGGTVKVCPCLAVSLELDYVSCW